MFIAIALTLSPEISSEQTQLVINSITDAYNSEGQANPLHQNNMHPGMGGFPGGPPGPGFPPQGFPPPGKFPIVECLLIAKDEGMPGIPPPQFIQAGRGGRKSFPE
jgi:U1 small nuclear ribonucleoprotein C